MWTIAQVDEVYKKVYSGSLIDYAKSYKNSLKKNILPIGPFSSKELIEKAQQYYDLGKLNYDEVQEYLDELGNDGQNFYFYYTKPNFLNSDKSLHFTRIPSRISSGSTKDYIDIFIEGLTQQLIAIGPFDDLLNAEKSKYISRKYGESVSTQPQKDEKAIGLKAMSESWKSLKINIVDFQFNENRDYISCNLNIPFPPNYFDRNTLQVIHFGYSNDGKITSYPDGITVQGEEFQDNNLVIPQNEGRRMSYSVTIPYVEGQKTQIIIKSTLFNDKDMIDCTDIILDFKPE